MSEIFGIDFDKHLYKSLFDEIDFKDLKPLLTNKNCPNKLQYFVQEFPAFIERSDFVNIFSQILMTTTNISTAVEIFEGLNKMAKLSYENQFKLIISFIYSMNDRFVDDAKNILVAKCHELLKENKGHGLSESTVQTLLLFINSMDGLKTDPFFGNSFISFLIQDTEGNNDDMKQIELIQSMVETSPDEPIEMEKMLHDLGPFTVNGGITFANGDLLDFKLDEKRLAGFIIFLIKHQSWVEDKESRYLNKVFLKSLNNDAAIAIDENIEKKQTVYWNMDQFYKMFKNQIDSMDMAQVFNFFDDPLFCVKDKKTFEYLMTTLQKLKGTNYNNLLFNLIFKRWNNELNQIEFLNFLIHNTQVELFSFKNSPGRKVKKNFELGITVNKTAVFHLIESWSCIDLLEVLLKLSKGNYYMKIKEMFDWPIANVPELIVIGLAMIKAEPDDFLYEEIINEALPIFLGNHVNSLVVLEETWNLNKDLVIKTICHMYRSNPDLMNLSRILDITQKLKESLIPIVSCKDYVFAVNLAILAVKRDFLHIDQWLSERIARVGDEFIESLLNFIKENVIALCKDVTNPVIKENILEKCQLSLESLAIIFENLTPSKIGKNPRVSKRIEAEITNTYKAIFEIFDELQVQPPNSEEIEEAANKFYQNLFHGDITVEEIIEKMKTYKNSPNHKESEIYACMIHSLLDEYRFFHQYPDKELKIIANLFGQIINQKLLDGIIETIALKYVLEGIKKGSGNMFTFATIALEQFVDKLHLWPQYLQSLTEIPALKNYPTLHDRVIEKLNETISKSKQKVEESFNGKGANNPIITIEDKSHNKAIERELQESLKNVTNTSSNIIRKTSKINFNF